VAADTSGSEVSLYEKRINPECRRLSLTTLLPDAEVGDPRLLTSRPSSNTDVSAAVHPRSLCGCCDCPHGYQLGWRESWLARNAGVAWRTRSRDDQATSTWPSWRHLWD
jgi:hypothetical protein